MIKELEISLHASFQLSKKNHPNYRQKIQIDNFSFSRIIEENQSMKKRKPKEVLEQTFLTVGSPTSYF